MRKNLYISNFKKLPRACLLALFLIAASYIIELFILPIDFFMFRTWEALCVKKLDFVFPGPFYPNMKISKVEEGDLGHHTKYAVRREVTWETDRYGYRRKDEDVNKYKIVIVGDSCIAGSGLTQSDMLSEVLERRLNAAVYPLAPADMNTFLNSKRFIHRQPDVIILGVKEREIARGDLPEIQLKDKPIVLSQPRRILQRYLSNKGSLAILLDRLYKDAMCNYIIARIKQKGRGVIYNDTSVMSNMLFVLGVIEKHYADTPEEEVNNIIEIIKSYDKILKDKSIDFIFLPVPNKENIYFEYLPIKKRPVFLRSLISRLKSEGIKVIDTQQHFEEAYSRSTLLLYQPDDTHWSAEAIKLTADLIVKEL